MSSSTSATSDSEGEPVDVRELSEGTRAALFGMCELENLGEDLVDPRDLAAHVEDDPNGTGDLHLRNHALPDLEELGLLTGRTVPRSGQKDPRCYSMTEAGRRALRAFVERRVEQLGLQLAEERLQGRPDLDVDPIDISEWQVVGERDDRSSNRYVEDDPFCDGCGSVWAGDGLCPECRDRVQDDLVTDGAGYYWCDLCGEPHESIGDAVRCCSDEFDDQGLRTDGGRLYDCPECGVVEDIVTDESEKGDFSVTRCADCSSRVFLADGGTPEPLRRAHDAALQDVFRGLPEFLPEEILEDLQELGIDVPDDLDPRAGGLRGGLWREDIPDVVATVLAETYGPVKIEARPSDPEGHHWEVEWSRVDQGRFVDVDSLEYVRTEDVSGAGDDEPEYYAYFRCPSCDETLAEWTDCPGCGFYSKQLWERTMEELPPLEERLDEGKDVATDGGVDVGEVGQ